MIAGSVIRRDEFRPVHGAHTHGGGDADHPPVRRQIWIRGRRHPGDALPERRGAVRGGAGRRRRGRGRREVPAGGERRRGQQRARRLGHAGRDRSHSYWLVCKQNTFSNSGWV